ncbi:MAG: 50S ribosomal protein L21e [Nanoarchaeota archaeon]|nr:50S ribosomal protein L21e [Nanoarchaeota archaeon]
MQRIGGARRKTRNIFKKHKSQKGKISITKYLKKYKPGDKVLLKAEPAYQKGIYYRRFHGKIGVVTRQRGFCYEIAIKDANKAKSVIVHPIHLEGVK